MATQDRTVSAACEGLSSELRRGIIALAVLAECRTPQYGYSLKQSLHERGLDVNEGTLYPLMRRLEEQTLLASEWQIVDGERPRRYYHLSPIGESVLAALRDDWHALSNAMTALLGDVPPTPTP